MIVATTGRLVIRWFDEGDAGFIVALLNDPDWIRNIGNRGVRTLDDAVQYLQDGPIASYRAHGFGLSMVALKATRTPIGMCGLIRRDTLPDVDLGFAFLPAFRGAGYALEAAQAVMADARKRLGVARILAILSAHNERSRRLLVRLGFRANGTVCMRPGEAPLDLYVNDAMP